MLSTLWFSSNALTHNGNSSGTVKEIKRRNLEIIGFTLLFTVGASGTQKQYFINHTINL